MVGWVRSESVGARCSHARALERARASSPLLGVTAAPAFAAASISDLANVRIVCVAQAHLHQLADELGQHAEGGRQQRHRRPDSRDPQPGAGHYSLLAPLLNGTAPVDDDYTYTFPAGALRSFDRASNFALDLEEMLLGIAIGAAATTDDRGVAQSLGADRRERRSALLRALGAHRRLGRPGQRAARALARRRRQSALPVPLQLGGNDDSHLLPAPHRAARCSFRSRSSRPSPSGRAPAPGVLRRR